MIMNSGNFILEGPILKTFSGLPKSLCLRHSTFVLAARTGVSSPAGPLHPLLSNATGNPGSLVNAL